MAWKLFCTATLVENLYVNIKLGSIRFAGAADLESNLYGTWKNEFEMWWVPPNRFTPGFSLLPALKNMKPGTETCTYLNRAGFSIGGTIVPNPVMFWVWRAADLDILCLHLLYPDFCRTFPFPSFMFANHYFAAYIWLGNCFVRQR